MRQSMQWRILLSILLLWGCTANSTSGEDSTDSDDAQDSDSNFPPDDTDTRSDENSTDHISYNGIPGTAPGTCGYAYAPYDLLASVDDSESTGWLKYRYDATGNLVSLECKALETEKLNLQWEGFRLVAARLEVFDKDDSLTFIEESTFEYNLDNLPTVWRKFNYSGDESGNGTNILWRFNYEGNRVTRLEKFSCTSQTECSEMTESLTYEYTDANRIARIFSDTGSSTYTYDSSNRLTSTSISSSSTKFVYNWRDDGRLATKQFANADIQQERTYEYVDNVLTQSVYDVTATTYAYTEDADACTLLRAWPIRFLTVYNTATSQEVMMVNYGDSALRDVLW